MIAGDIAHALDPVLLARDCGIEPDPWQAALLRERPRRSLLLCSAAIREIHGHGADSAAHGNL